MKPAEGLTELFLPVSIPGRTLRNCTLEPPPELRFNFCDMEDYEFLNRLVVKE
ncbi:unnamed protein product, partial [Amoebophrya sp. A25]